MIPGTIIDYASFNSNSTIRNCFSFGEYFGFGNSVYNFNKRRFECFKIVLSSPKKTFRVEFEDFKIRFFEKDTEIFFEKEFIPSQFQWIDDENAFIVTDYGGYEINLVEKTIKCRKYHANYEPIMGLTYNLNPSKAAVIMQDLECKRIFDHVATNNAYDEIVGTLPGRVIFSKLKENKIYFYVVCIAGRNMKYVTYRILKAIQDYPRFKNCGLDLLIDYIEEYEQSVLEYCKHEKIYPKAPIPRTFPSENFTLNIKFSDGIYNLDLSELWNIESQTVNGILDEKTLDRDQLIEVLFEDISYNDFRRLKSENWDPIIFKKLHYLDSIYIYKCVKSLRKVLYYTYLKHGLEYLERFDKYF